MTGGQRGSGFRVLSFIIYVILGTAAHCVAQAGLKLVDSQEPPTSAS